MLEARNYQVSDKEFCLALFQSNVPKFFKTHETAEFEEFLDNLPGPYLQKMQVGMREVSYSDRSLSFRLKPASYLNLV